MVWQTKAMKNGEPIVYFLAGWCKHKSSKMNLFLNRAYRHGTCTQTLLWFIILFSASSFEGRHFRLCLFEYEIPDCMVHSNQKTHSDSLFIRANLGTTESGPQQVHKDLQPLDMFIWAEHLVKGFGNVRARLSIWGGMCVYTVTLLSVT